MQARIEGADASTPRPAPTIGQHNREVLAELGYEGTDIDRLETEGVLWTTPAGSSGDSSR